MSVRDFKSLIAKEYSKKFHLEEKLARNRVRIREKGVERLGKIMRDGRYVKDYGLCQNKVYAIQILDVEEVIIDDSDVMVVIREWVLNKDVGFLTKKREILLNRKMSYHEIIHTFQNLGVINEYLLPDKFEI